MAKRLSRNPKSGEWKSKKFPAAAGRDQTLQISDEASLAGANMHANWNTDLGRHPSQTTEFTVVLGRPYSLEASRNRDINLANGIHTKPSETTSFLERSQTTQASTETNTETSPSKEVVQINQELDYSERELGPGLCSVSSLVKSSGAASLRANPALFPRALPGAQRAGPLGTTVGTKGCWQGKWLDKTETAAATNEHHCINKFAALRASSAG
ncbi:hypothetical protein BDV93DRAFT_505454 [Ceratobasidium sp. AG-I]|nr:hypothetical protein BDV93DRAFT_505454 [Ceratobasidium sp. AG-I]